MQYTNTPINIKSLYSKGAQAKFLSVFLVYLGVLQYTNNANRIGNRYKNELNDIKR